MNSYSTKNPIQAIKEVVQCVRFYFFWYCPTASILLIPSLSRKQLNDSRLDHYLQSEEERTSWQMEVQHMLHLAFHAEGLVLESTFDPLLSEFQLISNIVPYLYIHQVQ